MQKTTECSTAATAESMKRMAINRLEWDARFSDSLLNALPDEHMLTRAGGAGNHAAWVLGHMAQSMDFIVAMVSGEARVLDESWDVLFGGGSEPADDCSGYPSLPEMREGLDRARARTMEWVNGLDETTMFEPVPEPLQPFANDAISVPFTIVAHNLFHVGQVATIRASLGNPPVHR